MKAGGEGNGRGWDGSMASPTQWTWVWVCSESSWCTNKPGVWNVGQWSPWNHKESDTTEWAELNLGKYAQDKEIKNYKTFLIGMKEDVNKLRKILCYWIGRLTIGKFCPIFINTFSITSIIFPADF